MILEGKTLATAIKEKLPARAREIASALGRAPRLVGISWQGDYAGHLYLNKEAAAARKAGIRADIVLVDENTSEKDFKTLLSKIYEIWYTIQISMLHPILKNVYSNPSTFMTHISSNNNKKKKKNNKKKKIVYYKKHIMLP